MKVVDADTGAIIGSISDLKRVHGIALVSELGRGFLSDGGADEAVVFDMKTLKVTGHIKTGGNPDCIIYDPTLKHIFTMNGKTNDASVIDPVTTTVVVTIPIGGRPEYAVADSHGTIYDNVEDKNEVVAIDSMANTVKTHWPIAPAEGATAIDLDVKHHRLFIGGRNKLQAIMNVENGKIIQTFPIGAGVDTNIFDPETGTLFVAVREGILHVFHEDTPTSSAWWNPSKRNLAPATWPSIRRRISFSLPPLTSLLLPSPLPISHIPNRHRCPVHSACWSTAADAKRWF